MKQQERDVSERDEIAVLSVPGASSRQKQTTLFIRTLATAFGFGMSAGWDWLPSMHALWLRDYLHAVSRPGPFGFFETLSGTIFFKMLMLLVLCPVIERLFLAFPVGESVVRPSDEPALFSPSAGERLYFMFPFMLVQAAAIVLLALLTFFLPPYLVGLVPWLLGTVSALLGIIWFVLMALLPGVWACIAYALALTSSIFITLILIEAPTETLARFRVIFPLLAVPLLFFAIPSTEDIRSRVVRHRRQRLFSTRMRGFLLRSLLLRRLSFFDLLSKQGSGLLVLFLFPMLYGLQQLLDFSTGCPLVCVKQLPNPPLQPHIFLILSGEVCGAFLTSSLVAFFPGHILLSPMLGFSLFGCGTLLTSVFPLPPFNSFAFYLLQVASGCCAAFGFFILHRFFERNHFLFRTVSRILVLVSLLGSMGGYLLWALAEGIHNEDLSSHGLFMHLLTLGSIACLFCIYLVRIPLMRLINPQPKGEIVSSSAEWRELPPADPFESLTPREREVAKLVRTGMKNLEISLSLNISETTLRVHLRRIYRKLGIRGRVNLREFNNRDQSEKKG